MSAEHNPLGDVRARVSGKGDHGTRAVLGTGRDDGRFEQDIQPPAGGDLGVQFCSGRGRVTRGQTHSCGHAAHLQPSTCLDLQPDDHGVPAERPEGLGYQVNPVLAGTSHRQLSRRPNHRQHGPPGRPTPGDDLDNGPHRRGTAERQAAPCRCLPVGWVR